MVEYHIIMKVKVAQSCPAPCNPMDYTVHGILQARILEWVAIPCSRGSSQPRDSTWQVDFLPAEPQGKSKNTGMGSLSLLQQIFLTQESNWVSCIADRFFTNWDMWEASCIQLYAILRAAVCKATLEWVAISFSIKISENKEIRWRGQRNFTYFSLYEGLAQCNVQNVMCQFHLWYSQWLCQHDACLAHL